MSGGGGSEAGQYSRQYGNTAASLYNNVNTAGSNLSSQGNTLYNSAAGQLGPLITQFMQSAGLGNGSGASGSSGTPNGNSGLPAGAGANAATTAGGGTVQGQGASGGGPGSQTGQNATLPGGGMTAPVSPTLQQAQASNPGFNPYQLDVNQQAYLSSQLDAMNQQVQSQVQQYHSSLAASGINDSEASAAGAAYIQQQGQLQQNQFVTSYMQQQQQQKEQALSSLITLATQQEGLGIQTEQAGAGVQGGAASGYAGLSSENANESINQEAQSAQETAGVGSLVTSLLPTSWFTGTGFGAASAAGSAPGT